MAIFRYLLMLIITALAFVSCGPGLKINEKNIGASNLPFVRSISFSSDSLLVKGNNLSSVGRARLETDGTTLGDGGKVLKTTIETPLVIHDQSATELKVNPTLKIGLITGVDYRLFLNTANAESMAAFVVMLDENNIDIVLPDGSVTNSKIKDRAVTADKLHSMGATDGDILKFDSTLNGGVGGWYTAPEAGSGSGGVTSITASTGLLGGTITSSGVIAVDVGTGAGQIPTLDGSADFSVIKNINVAETGKIVLKNSAGPQNFSILNDGSLKLYDETNGASRFEIDNVGDITIGGGVTIGGQAVCLADGTDCPPSGAGGTVTSVDASGGLTGGPIVNSGTLSIANGGVTAAKLSQMGASTGQVIKWNGATWEVSSDNDSGGTLTQIIAGTGLDGGTINTSGTISISNGGVTSTHILDGTIGASDITDGAITASKINQMSASTGEALKWNGSTWEASTDISGISSITAGTGLDGGTITTSGTISISTGGVTSTLIANGTIYNVDIASDASIDMTKLGFGDLTIDHATASPKLIFRADNNNTVTFTTPTALGNTYALTFPHALGSNGQFLRTDASGNLTWADATVDSTGINDESVTLAKMATFTDGYLIVGKGAGIDPVYVNVTGDASFLSTGVLTINSGAITASKLNQMSASTGETMKWNGATWEASTDLDGVTSITAGTGLDGGTITTSGTISLSTGGVTSAHLANGTIYNVDVANDASIDMGKLGFGNLTIDSSTASPNLIFRADNNNTVTLTTPAALPNTYTLTFPTALGTIGQYLRTSAVGDLYWSDASVDSAGINDEAVTLAKMATFTDGYLIVGKGAGIDPVYVNVTGDASFLSTGVMTINSGAITASKLNQMGASSGQTLKWDGGTWIATDDGGGITSITAGTGLDGGTITTSGTISLSTGGVTSAHLANGTIYNVDVANDASIDMGKLGFGNLTIDSSTASPNLIFRADNNNTVTLTTPAALPNTYTLTFPTALGSLGQYLKTNAVGDLYWGDASIDTIELVDKSVTLAKMADLTSANFIIGDGTNRPSAATMSGDGSLTNTGVFAIGTGVIVDADVSSSASIDATKLGTGIVSNTEFNYLDGVTSAIQTQINNVSTDANSLVTLSKMANLTSTNFIIGDGSNRPSAVTMSGDGSLTNTGVFAIGTGVIVNADVSSSAAIDATKLGTGIVSNTEFNYLDGVTSAIQTQINNVSTDANSLVTLSKMANLTSANFIIGDGSNRPSAVTMSGDGSLTNTGVFAIGTGVIVNSDVSSSAAIDATKLGTGIVSNTEFNYLDGVTSAIQTQINNVSTDANSLVTLSKMANLTSANFIIGDGSNRPSAVTMSGDGSLTNTGVFAIGTGVIVNADVSASAAIDATKLGTGVVDNTELSYLNGVTSAIQTQLDNISSDVVYKVPTYYFTRTLPTTVDDYVEVGSFSAANGAHNMMVNISVNDSSFSLTKSYDIIATWNHTGGVWTKVVPRHDSGSFGGNNIDLDAMASNGLLTLRIRRTSGSTAGTANIRIINLGRNSPTVTAMTGTGSTAAPTTNISSSGLIQTVVSGGKSFVGVGGIDPAGYLDVAGAIGAGTTSLVLRSGNGLVYPSASAQIRFGYNNTNTYAHMVRTRHSAGNAYDNAIEFYLWNTGLTSSDEGNTHMMSITGGGVGINGKYDPGYALDVSGDIRATGTIKLANTSGNLISLDASNSTFTSKTYYLPVADGSADDMLKTDGSGNLSFAKNLKTYRFARTSPSTVGDTIMLGSFSGGSNHFLIELYVSGVGFYWGNHFHYQLPWTYNRVAADTWFELVPLQKEIINFYWAAPTNDIAIDARHTSGGNLEFRMRRTAKDPGANSDASFNIELIDHTMSALTFTESTTTAAGVATPTLYYGNRGYFNSPPGSYNVAEDRYSEVTAHGDDPQVMLKDNGELSYFLHANSNKFYILTETAVGSGTFSGNRPLVIDGVNSRVGINQESPETALHVQGKGRFSGIDGANVQVDGSNNSTIDFTVLNGLRAYMGILADTNFYIHNQNTGHIIFRTNVGTQGSYIANWDGNLYNLSDKRFKSSIKELDEEETLNKILKLRPTKYHLKKSKRMSYGLIAQEVQKIYPDIVGEGDDGYLSLGYSSFIAPIISSIHAIYKKIVNIITDVDDLKKENQELKSKVDFLMEKMCKNNPNEEICQQ